jgi:hypothetical protein
MEFVGVLAFGFTGDLFFGFIRDTSAPLSVRNIRLFIRNINAVVFGEAEKGFDSDTSVIAFKAVIKLLVAFFMGVLRVKPAYAVKGITGV